MPFFSHPNLADEPVAPPRILFLDDDDLRAEAFLGDHPQAVWVQTAAECIARLEEPWDEVHLDHDLGGEQFVDAERDDCGMAVVRWIVVGPKTHLKQTQFFIHSHNMQAATVMGFQMSMSGYKVEIRPFGTHAQPDGTLLPSRPPTVWRALSRILRRLLRRDVDPEVEGYTQPHRDDAPDPHEPRPERPDFSWLRAAPAAEPLDPSPPSD
jgi:hypothetical protein